MLKRNIKILICTAIVLVGFSVYTAGQVPDVMYANRSQPLEIKSLPMVTLKAKKHGDSKPSSTSQQLMYTAKLFGVVPLKNVSVQTGDARMVSVAGTPFGIKMFSDGVMVVGFSDIQTSTGFQCPAKLSGLKMGDVIVKINGKITRSNDDVEKIILLGGGSPLKVEFLRDNMPQSAVLVPVKDANLGSYRTGMWVRDSSAGVGTMTFYDVQKGLFAGLGHGIKDTDTQKDIRLLSGEIVPVKIMGLIKSENGTAGELKGTFTSSFATGKILANSTNGVYGTIFTVPEGNLMQVASPQEISPGRATILTTISGTQPQEFDIVIEKIALTTSNQNKNMIIRITDPELLSLTGGIVQGMSGSPIMQNGKLVGAITHVFINQVERGYAVFAQNMVESMDNAEKVYMNAG